MIYEQVRRGDRDTQAKTVSKEAGSKALGGGKEVWGLVVHTVIQATHDEARI